MLLVAAMVLPVTADAANILRIADEGCNSSDGCDSGYCGNAGAGLFGGGAFCSQCNYGSDCDSCEAGVCSMRDRWQAMNLDWSAPCGPIGRGARRGVPGARQFRWLQRTLAFPDSGWAPPARFPVNYSGRGFASWYGNSGPFVGGAPMVYQPTDTAQLGYSYANVPTWGRNPCMIPPTPQPSMFHNRACPCGNDCRGCYGNCGPACYGGSCNDGSCYGGATYGGGCPTCGPGMVLMAPAAFPTTPAQPTVANIPAPLPTVRQVSRPVQQISAQKSHPQQRTLQPSQRRPMQNRRATSGQKKSRGWFGLPSLSEITF